MVRSLLVEFIPAQFIKDFDLATLERCNSNYISYNLRERRNDMVWRLRWRDSWCYIYLMLEFQSTQDQWMALRILSYTALLWEDMVKRGEVKSGDKLPPVFPIVLYNGETRWNSPQEVGELIDPTHAELAPFQPHQKYYILDEKHIPSEIVEAAGSEAGYILKVEQATTKEKIFHIAVEFDSRAWSEEFASTQLTMLEWMDRRIKQLAPHAPEPGDGNTLEETMLAELIAKYKKPYIEEGFAMGRAEGRLEGEAEGMRYLMKNLLMERFGPLPPEWESIISKIHDVNVVKLLGKAAYRVNSLDEFGEILLHHYKQE